MTATQRVERLTDDELCALPMPQKNRLADACGDEALDQVWVGWPQAAAIGVLAMAGGVCLLAWPGTGIGAAVALSAVPFMVWHYRIKRRHDPEFTRSRDAMQRVVGWMQFDRDLAEAALEAQRAQSRKA